MDRDCQGKDGARYPSTLTCRDCSDKQVLLCMGTYLMFLRGHEHDVRVALLDVLFRAFQSHREDSAASRKPRTESVAYLLPYLILT